MKVHSYRKYKRNKNDVKMCLTTLGGWDLWRGIHMNRDLFLCWSSCYEFRLYFSAFLMGLYHSEAFLLRPCIAFELSQICPCHIWLPNFSSHLSPCQPPSLWKRSDDGTREGSTSISLSGGVNVMVILWWDERFVRSFILSSDFKGGHFSQQLMLLTISCTITGWTND